MTRKNKIFLIALKIFMAGFTAYLALGWYDGGTILSAVFASIIGLLGGKSVDLFLPG